MRTRPHVAAYVGMALTPSLALFAAGVKQSQTPVPFRTGVVLIPLEVRVVDADGNPVTNLTASDFTILEDGVQQEIAHFSTRSYPALDADQAAVSTQPDLPFEPSATHRTFAIVLGRGRLNEPGKAVAALTDFVRTRLLPGDRVAVLAYLRATDLTTNHELIARLLERYRVQHEAIEGKLARDFRTATFAGVRLAHDTVSAIDALFDEPDLHAELLAGTLVGSRYLDLPYLVSGIQYLRGVEGEKHLIFVSEDGLRLGRVERPDDSYFARLATGARVTISIIHTGGISGHTFSRDGRLIGGSSLARMSQLLNPEDYRVLAEQTGGIAAFYQYAEKPLARLDRATRFQYLLGYYPAGPQPDTSTRHIRIKVRDRALTVFYHHTYQARPQLSSVEDPDTLRRVMAEARIDQAASSSYAYSSIPIKASASVLRREAGEEQVRVDVAIDTGRITFTRESDMYMVSLDVAAFAVDAQQHRIGETVERLDLKLDAAGFERLKHERILHTMTVKVVGRPAHLKVVVYDYDTDRQGTAMLRLP